ncbi:MAG TPA: RNA polymerase sigma factor [Ktedonobacteraceae bacterium]|nr:RNA polymerase sigma factor [Ktedonobacteraceae bacterium]
MFYSIAIPGILQAWPGASIDNELATQTAYDSGDVARTARGERKSSSLERTHTGMTMNKSTNSSDINTELSVSDAQVLDFGMLYEKFKRPVHSYIYRLLGSYEDADDLTQEVFTKAYVAWNDLYDRENLSSWLYRIATNLCIDQLRRRKRISWWPLTRRSNTTEQLSGDEELSYLPPDTGGIPEIAEREHIRLALASIPADYAIVLVLSAAQGVPYQEIGKIVGISPNAAATRISRAKRLFAEQYARLSGNEAAKRRRRDE